MDLSTYLSQHESAAALARRLGIAAPQVSQWKNGVRPVPAERCPAIERATAGAVTCEELRPDVDWAIVRGTSQTAEPPAVAPYTGPERRLGVEPGQILPKQRSTNGDADHLEGA